MRPIAILERGLTNPLAGVIDTSPAIAPVTVIRVFGFLVSVQWRHIQTSAAAAAEIFVHTKAFTAIVLLATALPELKPNQPNQSSPAPRRAMGTLFASRGLPFTKSSLFPITMAAASAENPALVCTTDPPAKSRTRLCSHPSLLQTKWAIGS